MALSAVVVSALLLLLTTVSVSSEWTAKDDANFKHLITDYQSGAQLLLDVADGICNNRAAVGEKAELDVTADSTTGKSHVGRSNRDSCW